VQRHILPAILLCTTSFLGIFCKIAKELNISDDPRDPPLPGTRAPNNVSMT
jgi:hypothetical protein